MGRAANYLSTWIIIAIATIMFIVPCIWATYENIMQMCEHWRKAKGIYFKELPIDTVVIRTSPLCKKRSRLCFKCSDGEVSFICKKQKERTRNLVIAKKSHEENQQCRFELLSLIANELFGSEICLLDRTGNVIKGKEPGEMGKYDEVHQNFRLDAVYSWKKKKNDEWLARQKTVVNDAGQVIGVRGIDKETASLGYDIYIPNADEQDICKMSLTELLKYCKAENCKLQIRENGSVFTYSDIPGYTKADVVKTIKDTAERQGYKVKIK